MAYEPQPFVATQSGSAGDAPSSAKPIALYGVEGGASGPIGIEDVTGLQAIINDLTGRIEELEGKVE